MITVNRGISGYLKLGGQVVMWRAAAAVPPPGSATYAPEVPNDLSSIKSNYHKVVSSGPVYYSILNSFGQRSYIIVNYAHHKILGCATD